ncbi:type II toxin-antitoxin system RelE/ParE family toxin [Caballeronia sp. TF1N1]|uniref:type II toxin-antitoxin system RelE/ParE family toxin n=1 Tax=Caballeronia sp. TF1N1 TaxID=2878153 RepID=UPI001FD6263E|nr:type II toxin-antitoxin system RelE/ParE family toxin [Caballeronia sp. TF1N1]
MAKKLKEQKAAPAPVVAAPPKEKGIDWKGSSLKDLLGFPEEVRREAGFQLGKIQNGIDPDDWKPFENIGEGVKEIRIKDAAGIFRVMYVAKFEEAIYVLHCFQKKTQATSQPDKDIAIARYKAVVQERKKK